MCLAVIYLVDMLKPVWTIERANAVINDAINGGYSKPF